MNGEMGAEDGVKWISVLFFTLDTSLNGTIIISSSFSNFVSSFALGGVIFIFLLISYRNSPNKITSTLISYWSGSLYE